MTATYTILPDAPTKETIDTMKVRLPYAGDTELFQLYTDILACGLASDQKSQLEGNSIIAEVALERNAELTIDYERTPIYSPTDADALIFMAIEMAARKCHEMADYYWAKHQTNPNSFAYSDYQSRANTAANLETAILSLRAEFSVQSAPPVSLTMRTLTQSGERARYQKTFPDASMRHGKLVYNKLTKKIDKVNSYGLVIESFEPPCDYYKPNNDWMKIERRKAAGWCKEHKCPMHYCNHDRRRNMKGNP